jgi:hypothetical protein
VAITALDGSEEWRRSFAGRPLVSWQYLRPEGLLAERIFVLELCFRLTAVNGALVYETQSAALCLSRLRLRFPRWLTPRVRAREQAADERNVTHVRVAITVPLLGPLLVYGGTIRIEEDSGCSRR